MFKSIIFTISVLLGQAGQDVFLVDANGLAETIESKESRNELKKLGKAYERAQKEYEFLKHNQADSFIDALQNREVKSSELRNLLADFKNEQKTYLSALIDLRIRIQAVADSSEWSEYMKNTYRKVNYPEGAEILSELQNTDEITSIQNTFQRLFSGSKYEAQSEEIFQNFLQNLSEITQNEADRQNSSGQILIRKDASRNELQKVLEDQFLFRRSLADAFIQFRAEVLKIVEPADWNSVAPKLSKLVYD